MEELRKQKMKVIPNDWLKRKQRFKKMAGLISEDWSVKIYSLC